MDAKAVAAFSLLAYAILFIGTILGVYLHVIPGEIGGVVIGSVLTHFGFVGGQTALAVKSNGGTTKG